MKSKIIKNQKLRNAEYYDIQKELDSLYSQSKRGGEFHKLIEVITSDANIEMAYRNLKTNSGSKTSGVDGKNIDDLKRFTNQELVDYARKRLNSFKPHKVKRVEIPKKNGKMRPLGIPTIYDRLLQQCILQVLEPICEAKFYEYSYGFRPHRSCDNAMARAYKLAQNHNLSFVVDMDIKGFFDNVNHAKLLKQLWTIGIKDKQLICIISKMLKAEIQGIGIPTKGTPQGGILSPLLANVVLNELDWWIASQWETFPTKHTYISEVRRYGKTGINNGNRFAAMRKSRLKECFIVRYADDFKIFCKSKQDAQKLFFATKNWLKERLKLDISPEKSKIVNLKTSYSEFLGIRFKLVKKGKTQKGKPKYVIKSHITEDAIRKINKNMHKRIDELKRSPDKRQLHIIVDDINMYVLGVHNYYDMATHIVKDLNKINRSVLIKLDHNASFRSLCSKNGSWKLPNNIVKKYSKSKCVRFINQRGLLPIGYIKTSPPLFPKKGINKYTPKGRELVHKELEQIDLKILHYLMRNPNPAESIEYNDNRLALFCAQNGKCAITKRPLTIGNIHCHHIKPRTLGGEDSYKNLKLVEVDVHRLFHATNSETIRNLLGKINPTPYQLKRINFFRTKMNNAEITIA